MNYRIETKDAFRIVGVSVPLQKDIEKNFAVIPRKWQETAVNGNAAEADRPDGHPTYGRTRRQHLQ